MSSKQTTQRLSTVDNAMSLLALFLKYESLGLIDIERETGVSKTAAFRLATTMADRGFLVKDVKTKQYHLGPILFQLVYKLQVNDIVTISEPFIQELANLTNESIYLSIRSGYSYIFLSGVNSNYPVKVTSPFGDELELHLGAAGKLHMAYMAASHLKQYFKKTKLKTYNPTISMNEQLIQKELEQIKEKGYSVSLGEAFPDSAGFSVPLWGLGEEPIAALSILLPMTRITTEKQHELINLLLTYSKQISNEYTLKKQT